MGNNWTDHKHWRLDWCVIVCVSVSVRIITCELSKDCAGVYEGTEEDTGACASSLLVMGTATGSVVLTAPEVSLHLYILEARSEASTWVDPYASSLFPWVVSLVHLLFPLLQNPGKYHFRYFFATGLAAAISETVSAEP